MNGRFFRSLSGHWPRGACFDGVPASTPQSHGAQAAWIHAPTRPLLPAEGPFSPRPSVSRAVRLSEFVAPSGDDGSVGPRYCRTSHIAAPASTSALNFPANPVNDPQPSGPCISCTSWESLLDNWSSTDDRARTLPVLIGNDDAKMKTVTRFKRFGPSIAGFARVLRRRRFPCYKHVGCGSYLSRYAKKDKTIQQYLRRKPRRANDAHVNNRPPFRAARLTRCRLRQRSVDKVLAHVRQSYSVCQQKKSQSSANRQGKQSKRNPLSPATPVRRSCRMDSGRFF